jgi:hypothetical protein
MMRVEVPTGISKAEQETVIRWDEGEKTVVIWSASPVVLRRLYKLGLTPASESRKRTGELHGREYKMPLGLFRWGLKRRGTARKRAFLPKTPRQQASLSPQQSGASPQAGAIP